MDMVVTRFFWWCIVGLFSLVMGVALLVVPMAHSQPIEPPIQNSVAWYLTPQGPLVVVYFQDGKFIGYEHTLVGLESTPAEYREKRDDGEFWYFSTRSRIYRAERGPVNRFHVREFCEGDQWDPELKRCEVAP